ncbi:MAG: hypothetical protein ACOC0Z_08735 [Halohasta sp.]
MAKLVADTSGLVSLGTAGDRTPNPLSLCVAAYDVYVPDEVIAELESLASYDDKHGRAAAAALDLRPDLTVQSVDLDATFPLDDGENAAVTLANETDAALLLCDEFNRLGLIHASLADTRLVTTPTLLSVFVRTDRLPAADAQTHLAEISAARSWDANSYVQRARSLFDES